VLLLVTPAPSSPASDTPPRRLCDGRRQGGGRVRRARRGGVRRLPLRQMASGLSPVGVSKREQSQ
jgi:hypothetical protein